MTIVSPALRLPATQVPSRSREHAALRGALVTSDAALARSFRRELKRGGRIVPLEVYVSLDDAMSHAKGPYAWAAVDLNGNIAPSDAVRAARRAWPDAVVALLSYRWSDREELAAAQADHVIHKPIRAPELAALFAGRCVSNDGFAVDAAALEDGLRPVS